MFSSNLPAPINEGPDPQTKEGNLIIGGVLRLGQFTTANTPSGTEGALYFNTTEKKMKVYSDSVWADLGGGAEPGQLPTYTTAQRDALSPTAGLMIYNTDYDQVQTYTKTAWSGITGNKALGIECASSMDCSSGFCVDSVCCDTSLANCNGDCETCNLAGTIGYCTVRANLDNTEVTTTCYYCNGTSDTSLAYTAYTGVGCTGTNACFSGSCLPSYCDEDNDARFTKIVAQCPSGRYRSTVGDDCNDSCVTCYPGSTATTSSPDGKDQDCDGTLDETLCTNPSTGCVNSCSWGSCSDYCAARPDCACSVARCGVIGDCYNGTVCSANWCGGSFPGQSCTCSSLYH